MRASLGLMQRMKCPSHLLSVSTSVAISSRNLNEIERCADVLCAKSSRVKSAAAPATRLERWLTLLPPGDDSYSPLISRSSSESKGSAFLSQKPSALYGTIAPKCAIIKCDLAALLRS